MPAGALPPSFAALPDDAQFRGGEEADSGTRDHAAATRRRSSCRPRPRRSSSPAGPPQFAAIPGTSLQYVANTDAALFRDTRTAASTTSSRAAGSPPRASTGRGRSPRRACPPDFARIPANGPRGFVLVSVPGTPQAQEALIEAQIPQQATLDRATAKLDVVYAGAPQVRADPGHADAVRGRTRRST